MDQLSLRRAEIRYGPFFLEDEDKIPWGRRREAPKNENEV